MIRDYTSPTWIAKRNEVRKRSGGRCERCKTTNGAHVHHLKYGKTLGDEPLEWLIHVCIPCHQSYHPTVTFLPSGRTFRKRSAKKGKKKGGKWKHLEMEARNALRNAKRRLK